MKKIIKRQQNQIPVPTRRRPAYQTRLHPPTTEPRERHSKLNHQSAVFSFSFIKHHWALCDYQLCNQPPSQFCRTQSFHRSSVCQAQLCVWGRRRASSLQVICVTQWKHHILASASLQLLDQLICFTFHLWKVRNSLKMTLNVSIGSYLIFWQQVFPACLTVGGQSVRNLCCSTFMTGKK